MTCLAKVYKPRKEFLLNLQPHQHPTVPARDKALKISVEVKEAKVHVFVLAVTIAEDILKCE